MKTKVQASKRNSEEGTLNSSVARVFIGVRKLHHGHACEVPSLNPPKIKKLKKFEK